MSTAPVHVANILWDWDVFQPVAATYPQKIVRLSGESLALFLATEELTEIDRWTNAGQEPDYTTRDTIEALTALAYTEIMENALLGTIAPFATDSVPDGMLECDGTTYLRTDYPDLYAVLASAYILDADHFIAPDLRSRFIVAAGAGSGLSTYATADQGGEESHQLTTAELASHSHGVTDPSHTHTEITATPAIGAAITGVPVPSAIPGVGVTGAAFTGISINNAGADTAHENRPPYFALRFGIWAI